MSRTRTIASNEAVAITIRPRDITALTDYLTHYKKYEIKRVAARITTVNSTLYRRDLIIIVAEHVISVAICVVQQALRARAVDAALIPEMMKRAMQQVVADIMQGVPTDGRRDPGLAVAPNELRILPIAIPTDKIPTLQDSAALQHQYPMAHKTPMKFFEDMCMYRSDDTYTWSGHIVLKSLPDIDDPTHYRYDGAIHLDACANAPAHTISLTIDQAQFLALMNGESGYDLSRPFCVRGHFIKYARGGHAIHPTHFVQYPA